MKQKKGGKMIKKVQVQEAENDVDQCSNVGERHSLIEGTVLWYEFNIIIYIENENRV
jgi:hypothetical protein